MFKGVACSFFSYDYPVLKEFLLFEDEIKLASTADIAAMKVAAIAGRGKKRDFVDVYFICRKDYSLRQVISHYQKEFEVFKQDLYHVYKSMIYFEDAEKDTMPEMYEEANWKEIETFFTKEVSKLIE